MPRRSWLSALDWGEFGFNFHLAVSIISFSLLLAIYATLLTLRVTNALDSRVFSIDHIDKVTQIAIGISQTSVIILTAALSLSMETLASDAVLRRRQSVAALQDNLTAWRGLGASFVSLWSARKLGLGVCFRITTVLLFFLAVSALQIVTPTVVTVETTNTTDAMILRAKQMTADAATVSAILNTTAGRFMRTFDAVSALPYVWGQRNTSATGSPIGYNGTLLFSPLEKAVSEDFVYTDPYAREARTFCTSIPPSSTDKFIFKYRDAYGGILSFEINVGTITPNNGTVRFQSNGAMNVLFGGEKATKSSPPNYYFSDTLFSLPPTSSTPKHIYAWAFISNRPDVLSPDGDRGVHPPTTYTMHTYVRSWVHNDSLTSQEEQPLSFTEPLNITFYVWPVACRFHLENTTAFVRGTNALISYAPIKQGGNSQSPFDHPYGESDPFVNSWSSLIDLTRNHFLRGEIFPETQLRPLLNETSAHYLTNLPLITSANRFIAFADILSRISASVCSLLLNAMQTTSPDSAWNPPEVSVQAQQKILAGRLRVNVLQLVLGIVSVLCTGVCMVFVVCGRPASAAPPPGGTEFMSGGVLELVHLMHLSALPRLIAGDNNEACYRGARRLRAENTTAEYTDGRLAVIGQKGGAGDDLPPTFHWSSPDIDYLDLTRKALMRAGEYKPVPMKTRGHFFATLTPHAIATAVSLGLLAVFHATLLVLWARGTLDHRLFSLQRIGFATELIAVTTQAFSVLTLALLCFTIQAISSDQMVRREQTLAELHDSLAAWSGLGAAAQALLFQMRWPVRKALSLVLVGVLYATVAALHISMPSVLSIGTVSIVGDVPPLSAMRMPGNVTAIGYNRTGHVWTPELETVVKSIPYLWEQRNSTRLPAGWNGTTFFATPGKILPSVVTLKDPYAVEFNIKCGVVPRSHSPNEEIVAKFYPAPSPASFKDATVTLKNTFDFHMPDGAYSIFVTFTYMGGAHSSTRFGGGKSSLDSPPIIQIDDQLVHGSGGLAMSAYEYGAAYLGFWSMRNDTLHLSSDIHYAPPVVQSFNATVWSWIINPNLTQEEQQANAFRENVIVDLYYYPLACSLFLENVTATITGDGSLIKVDPQNTNLHKASYPFLRALPLNGLERTFYDFMDASYIRSPDWIEKKLISASINGLASMEQEFSIITAMYYALLVEYWKTRQLQGDTTVGALWTPEPVMLSGTQPLLLARLRINAFQLFLGSSGTVVLILVALKIIWGHDLRGTVVRDGGVIDIISLLHGSSLPAILASADNEFGDTKVARRKQAERTHVVYSDTLLDVPERVQLKLIHLKLKETHTSSISCLPAFPPDEASATCTVQK